MLVSHNEIVTLCRKVFEALNRQCGEGEVIAYMVAEAEMMGLEGLAAFVKALPWLEQDCDQPPQVRLDTPQRLEVDLRRASVLCHLSPLLDYATTKLTPQGQVELVIRHCHNRWLCFGALYQLARQGYWSTASWYNGSAPHHVRFYLHGDSPRPTVQLGEDSADDRHSLRILISASPILRGPIPEDSRMMESEQLELARKQALATGIRVADSHWNTLKEIAARGLVEATDASRRGAGE
ncbi:DUF3726 domain-containing protein [Zobellella maritima]|uniref:DUF3726 domain-containing protein n=1 Tax=Zobellella maritima TaxID=2059725 RepID=UPI000E305A0C|nr:DUF3726 domain-containing protein [Zobellella maritima]